MVMALRPEHELHSRRRGRNLGLLVVLLLFVALIFGLTVVKVQQGDLMEGYDHRKPSSGPAILRTVPQDPQHSSAPAAPANGAAPAVNGGQGQ